MKPRASLSTVAIGATGFEPTLYQKIWFLVQT